jgi:hypothetical protein
MFGGLFRKGGGPAFSQASGDVFLWNLIEKQQVRAKKNVGYACTCAGLTQ